MSLIVHTIESAPFAENTYIARRRGRSDSIVFDPGFEPGLILNYLSDHQLTVAAILDTSFEDKPRYGHSSECTKTAHPISMSISGGKLLKAAGLGIMVNNASTAWSSVVWNGSTGERKTHPFS